MAEKTPIRTEAAPAPFQGAPYSQAVRVGDLVFVSGQLALKPDHAEIVGDTIQEQTEQVMQNLGAILDAAGSGLDKLVKTTVFLIDLGDFAGMNEVYKEFFKEPYPSRATVVVKELMGPTMRVELIAHANLAKA